MKRDYGTTFHDTQQPSIRANLLPATQDPAFQIAANTVPNVLLEAASDPIDALGIAPF